MAEAIEPRVLIDNDEADLVIIMVVNQAVKC
jgi:hypothetical protein